MKKKLGLVAILLLVAFFASQSLAAICPTIPTGLDFVSNLEWGIKGQTVRMNPGINSENPYLQSGLEWDITSGELKAVTKAGIVEALQLAEQAQITEKFLGQYDETHLELSPSFKYGLYTQKQLGHYELYSFSLESNKTIDLGSVSDNLAKIQYSWYQDDEAILTVTPIYGSGYQVIDVCLDGSCFVDLSQLINQTLERPAIFRSQKMLAIYSSYADTSTIWLYDLNTKKIASEFTVNIRLLPQLNPIWSEDGKSLYVIGFDKNLSDLFVYRFDLDDQQVTEISALNKNIDNINDWLIAPERNLLVLSTPQIIVTCYP